METGTTSDADYDDDSNCVDLNVINNIDNTLFATCIEDISIVEEIAGNDDDLPFGAHVQRYSLMPMNQLLTHE